MDKEIKAETLAAILENVKIIRDKDSNPSAKDEARINIETLLSVVRHF